ncbi:MAG: acetyltransferase [Candidatus Sedimenticola sp. (ex Thyasira tokunagai)]
MASNKNLIVYAVRSDYIVDVEETILRLGLNVRAYIDNMEAENSPEVTGPIVKVSGIDPLWLDDPIIIPLVTPGHRKKVEEETRQLGFSNYPPLIDPTAVIASSVVYGEGFMVNAGAVLAAKCNIGRFVLVNRSVSIGHHAIIEDYVGFGPGALLCGGCKINQGAFIGAGAIITPQTSVGRNAIVGAGAVVVKDVPDNCVVIGNPARVIKQNITGYNEVSV